MIEPRRVASSQLPRFVASESQAGEGKVRNLRIFKLLELLLLRSRNLCESDRRQGTGTNPSFSHENDNCDWSLDGKYVFFLDRSNIVAP